MRRALFLSSLLVWAGPAGAEPKVAATHKLRESLPLKMPVGASFDAVRSELWLGGYSSQNLVVVAGSPSKAVASVEKAGAVRAVAADGPRGRVYALNSAQQIVVVDAAARSVLRTIDFGPGFRVHGMAVDPDAGTLYLLRDKQNAQLVWQLSLIAVDPANGQVLKSLALPTYITFDLSWPLLVSGGQVFVVQRDAALVGQNQLWVIATNSLSVVQKVGLGQGWVYYGLARDAQSGSVFVSENSSGRVFELTRGADGKLTNAVTLIAVGAGRLAVDSATHRLIVGRQGAWQVYLFNTQTRISIGSFYVPAPNAIALDPAGGRAYVPSQYTNSVAVVDLKKDMLSAILEFKSDRPSDLALEPGSRRAFIAAGGSNSVLYWNRDSGAIERVVPFDPYPPNSIAAFRGSDYAFLQAGSYLRNLRAADGVADWMWDLGGNISVVSGSPSRGELLATQTNAEWPDNEKSALLVFDAGTHEARKRIFLGDSTLWPRGVADNPFTGKAYVALFNANKVAVVDLDAGRVVKEIPAGWCPEGVAVDPVYNRVFVSNFGSHELLVIDGESDEVIAKVPVGKSPRGIAVKRKGLRVYVANTGDDTVSVIDGRELKVVATLKVGGAPQNIAVDEDGERVFVVNYASSSVSVIDDPASFDSRPPHVVHSPVSGTLPENASVRIVAEVTDDLAVAVVTLTFWEEGAGRYVTVPMRRADGFNYEARIPASFLLGLRGSEVRYFIDATDHQGNGPPTGGTPGTASHPNRFTVQKSLVKGWNFEFGHVYGGFYRMIPGPSAAIADIRPEIPGLEIATGNEEYYPIGYASGGPLGRWFVFQSNGSTVFWKNTENDEAHSSINLYDLDGDGDLEMLGGTTSGNQMQAWDKDGKWLWRYILGSHAVSTPAVEILNPGEGPTVFGGSFDEYLRAVDGKTGTLKWAFPAGQWIWSSAAVADLDLDGKKEVVFATDGERWGVATDTKTYGVLFCLDAQTGQLKWKRELSRNLRGSAALADLDGDGRREVLIGDDHGVFHAFRGSDGAGLWSYPTGGPIYSSPAVGDLDGDGDLEIVFGSADGKLYALDSRGSLFWKADLGSPVHGSPALARRGPSRRLDAYATSAAGGIFIVNGATGEPVAGLGVGAGVVSSPIVADTDGDGKLEIFFQDRKGDMQGMKGDRFWAIRDTGSSVEPFAREWPMFRADPAHTGVYRSVAPPVAKVDLPPGAPAGLTVAVLPEGGKLSVSWSPNPENDIAGYKLYRDEQFLASVTGTALLDSGLSDGKSYAYRVSAVDKAGQEGPKSAPVAGTPRDSLAPVSRLTSPASGTALHAPWTSLAGTAEDHGIAGVAKVEVLLKDKTAGTESWLLAAGTTSFGVKAEGLLDAHAYEAASRATDSEGNVEVSLAAISFTVDLPPPAPAGLKVAAPPEGGGLNVSWDASSASDAAGYRVYRDEQFLLAVAGTGHQDGGLTDGKSYAYRVSAVDKAGQEGPKSAPVSGTPKDSLAPVSRLTNPPAGGVVRADWAGLSGTAEDRGIAGVVKVDVFLKDKSAGTERWLLAAGTTSFGVKAEGLLDEHAYEAASRATDAEGNVESSLAAISFTVDLPPPAPTGLKVAAPPEGGALNVSWDASAAADAAGYRVYRDESFLAAAAGTGHQDGGLSDGKSYAYRVSAVDKAGQEGPKSASVSGTPKDGLAPISRLTSPSAGTTVVASWTKLSGTAEDRGIAGVLKVEVLLKDKTAGTERWFLAEGTTSFAVKAEGLLDAHAYEAASRASDAEGNVEAGLAAVEFTVDLPPPAPTGLKLAAPPEGGALALSWDASSAADAAGYRIYRDEQFLLAVTGTGHQDGGLTDGKSYAYRVSAVDKAGQEGPKSAPVAGTPKDALAPVSRLTSPAAGTILYASWAKLGGTAEDRGIAGVVKVDVLLKDKSAGTERWLLATGTTSFGVKAEELLDAHAYEAASRATDAEGNVEGSLAAISFTVDLPPPAPTGLKVAAPPEGGALNVSWDASAAADAAGYRVYRDESFLAAAAGTGHQDGGLSDGKSYAYRVSAVDKAGQEGPKSAPVAGTPKDGLAPISRLTSPAAGTTLLASSTKLSGTAEDRGIAGVVKVEVLLKDKTAGTERWLLAEGTTSFGVKAEGLLDAHAYEAAPRATDAEGNVESSLAAISFTVNLPLPTPTGLKLAAPPEGGALVLSWDASPAAGAAGYRVYRDEQFLIATTGPGHRDSGLTDGKSYSYRVSAADKADREGPKSEPVTGTPRDSLPPASRIVVPAAGAEIGTTALMVSGTAKDEGVAGIAKVSLLLKDSAGAMSFVLAASGAAEFFLELKGLSPGVSYELASRAEDKEGNVEAKPVFIAFKVAPLLGPVRELAAKPADDGGSALLSWKAPAMGDAAGYRVYAGTELLWEGKELERRVTGLFPERNYSNEVAAVDKYGREGARAAVSYATPSVGKAKAEIRTPKDGKRLWGNAVTIVARATEETVKVRFQQRHEALSAWSDIELDADEPFTVYWNISDANVSTGPHRLRAIAYDAKGLPDPAPAEIGVIIDDANAEIVEDGNPGVDPNKEHKLTQKVSPEKTEEIVTADGTAALIPKGAMKEDDELQIRSVPAEEAPKAQAPGKLLKSAGVFREFTFASGKRKFDTELLLSLPVPDADGDGIVDGSDIPVSELKVYYFDEASGKWLPLASEQSASQAKTAFAAAGAGVAQDAPSGAVVRFTVDHFTLFGLFQEFSAQKAHDFGEVYAFPNPARGGKKPTFHIEAGPADRVEIKVFDSAGELVHSATLNGPARSIDDGQGPELAFEYEWDTGGVGSGVYSFIVAAHQEGVGTIKKSGRLSVIK